MPDAGDHKVYLTGAIAILAEYPEEVMIKISDPRTGTRLLKDRPSLPTLRQACEQFYAPIAREIDREAARRAATPLPPQRPRTAEEQARIDAQVADARRQLGIPKGGLERERVQRRPLPPADPTRVRTVIADCEARRARNEQRPNHAQHTNTSAAATFAD